MKEIVQQFQCQGTYSASKRFGDGHINETYLVELKNPNSKVIIQKINHYVFKQVDILMSNYEKITTFMQNHLSKDQDFIQLIKTKDHKSYYFDGTSYYRMITFIDHAVAYDAIPSAKHMYLAGRAFGEFQGHLAAFDATQLQETIPNFHHTPKRLIQLDEAVSNASPDRLSLAQPVLDIINQYREYTHTIVDAIERKQVPIRVTHNDTKMNNILFDEKTNAVKCIVDLDTIMPGSLLYDFGDAIRFGCNQAKEDEQDTQRIELNVSYFKAYTEGFLSAVQSTIETTEVALLVDGALLMTLEVGIRFLTDFLRNDVYFKIHYPEHNLVRAINQITFFNRLKSHEGLMRLIVLETWKAL